MKTEPTEACKMIEDSWYAIPYMGTDYQQDPDIVVDKKDVYEIAKKAFEEGQFNPKIKQLEWEEVYGLGEIGIKAKTLFGNYVVYEKSDHDGYVLWCLGKDLHFFDTETQAKMYAQADFEARIKEYLITE